ncbi:phage tail tube protein [Parabacteroides gordonii]|uniref:phage tail tube protein n=1 Tax=Parabacteroides gordonii TaxID=574930 RepID=UPI000ECC31E5|nr:phage tail tube protein [Parabacteroides gordonii]RGP17284.1 hypothetical protein DXB27_07445 [Parabacteroides gordonii]
MTPIKHDSNADIFRGQLFLFVGETPIAYGTNATMNTTTEEVDTTNKMMSGGWKGSSPGQKSYAITSESLITRKEGQLSYDTLLDKQINDETLEFFFGEAKVTERTNVGGKFELDKTKKYYTGQVMITSLDLTSEVNGIANCSVSLSGIGALVPGPPPPTT